MSLKQNSGEPQSPSTTVSFSRKSPEKRRSVDYKPVTVMHWSPLAPRGKPPPGLRAHCAELVKNRLFIFGGCDSKASHTNLYIFDTEALFWTCPKTTGPAPYCRTGASTVIGHRIYVIGSSVADEASNTVYVLDTETLAWETLSSEGAIPPARRNPIIWTHNNRLHTFGEGLDIHAMSVDNHRWAAVQTLGEAPSRRKYQTFTLVRNRLIVYGGSDGHTCFGELYMLDMESLMWSQVRLPMHPRLAHSTTLVGSYLFVIGGHDGGRYLNEVHLLNLVTLGWETRKVAGRFPNVRGYHSATLADSRIFMLGGYDGETVFDELWILDLSAQAYLPQITSFEIALDF